MTALALKKKVRAYFDGCDERGQAYGRFALCVSLGLSHEEYCALEVDESKSGDTARRATTRILAQIESPKGWWKDATGKFLVAESYGLKDTTGRLASREARIIFMPEEAEGYGE